MFSNTISVILTILPEKLRFLSNYRMLIYAIVLIVMMLFNWSPKLINLRKKGKKMDLSSSKMLNEYENLIISKKESLNDIIYNTA